MAKAAKTLEQLASEVLSGGPDRSIINGDKTEYQEDDGEGGEGDNEGEKKEEKKPTETADDRLARLEQQNAELRGQLSVLANQKAAPVTEKKQEKPKKDWEKMLFEDTDNAVETLRNEIREEVTAELSNKYTKDIGEREFWRDFYDNNKDLDKAKDGDLVQATLNKNLAILGDLPVAEAAKKLADLTRERIIQYTGKKPADKTTKSKVEEGGSGVTKTPAPTTEKIVSLGDVIRARKTARMNAKAQTA